MSAPRADVTETRGSAMPPIIAAAWHNTGRAMAMGAVGAERARA
jgi:hypothetical protein